MFIKPIRLGRDAEVRFTANQKAVCNFAGAYQVGYGDNQRTQWIDCVIWGERGQKASEHLKKGTQIVIYGDDLRIDEYPKNDNTQGHKLCCTVSKFEFVGPKQEVSQEPQRTAPQPEPQPQQQSGGFDNFEDGDSDSIPF